MLVVWRVTYSGAANGDGFLLVQHSEGDPYLWLKDSTRRTLRKGSVARLELPKINSGTELRLAGYLIQVLVLEQTQGPEETVTEKENQVQVPDRKRHCEGATDDDSSIAKVKEMKIDAGLLKLLKPHQVEAVHFVLRCLTRAEGPTGALLADDMGTGKTLAGLAALHTLTRHFTCKAVVVCPSSLVLTWQAEVKKWFPGSLAYSAVFILSNSDSDALVYSFVHSSAESRPLLVISYDLFRTFSVALNATPKLRVLLCDEGHRIKNAYGTKTTAALCSSHATMRVVLTGTPVQNNLDELYAIVNFACPQYLGSLGEFRSRYVGEEGLSGLKDKLARVMLRRSKDEILRRELPPRSDLLVCVSLTPEYRAEYLRVVEKELGREDEGGDTMLPALMKLRLLCSLRPQSEGDEAHVSSKLQVVLELVRAMTATGGGDKIVIVSNFTAVLDAVAALLRAARWSSLRIDGDVALDKREKIIKAFNSASNPLCILLLSAKAGGVGLTLTGANRILLMEPDWNPATDVTHSSYVTRFISR